jgi:glyoxylase-like metal-dependent hydrolase (beta-lactamase superfamily II)
MDTKNDWATWWRYYNQEAEFFQCTQPLSDGESIAIGPYHFNVIYTPGHATDGIVLYNKTNKVLLSSDTLWENDLAVITVRVEGSAALLQVMESLEKLSALDVRVVYPGHGQPFTDIKGAILRSRKKVTRYMDEKERIGEDLLKKITIYTLLMKKGVKENSFFSYLMTTHWFRETVDHYFNREYEIKYNELIDGFVRKGLIVQKKGRLFTTVLP